VLGSGVGLPGGVVSGGGLTGGRSGGFPGLSSCGGVMTVRSGGNLLPGQPYQ